MTRKSSIVVGLCAVVVVSAAALAITVASRARALEAPTESDAELKYALSIADRDADGRISKREFEHYNELRRAVAESRGALMINEQGELEIADKFAHDEEARAEFERRQHLKD